mmetsp:Transcript_2465/g.5765  ORF Transcript_2465/g.5765 Transcript_2465/m.5765 type:complete len:508 (-) Transcript_2465:48-1571(-)
MGQAFSALAHTVGDPCCEQEHGDYVAHVDTKVEFQKSEHFTSNMGDVFSVTLTKTGDCKLGFDLDYVPTREAMPVRAITGSLAEEWNREHADTQVLPGDRIVEVNGTHGNAEQMMRALQESEQVKITFVRLKKAKGVDDWEYVRTFQDRIEFEENMPTAIYELVPYQGDQAPGAVGLGDAVTGQTKSTATVIPWGGQVGAGAAWIPKPPDQENLQQPKLHAVGFPDPRVKLNRQVSVVGFHFPGREEAWDKLCGASSLSNCYDLGLSELQIEAPCEPGALRPFRTAEAAFQALKFWSIAGEFSSLSGESVLQKCQELSGQEDFTYAGFGSSWKGMLAVLTAKFKASSSWACMLCRTNDAFLLEHSSLVRDPGNSEGNNHVGLQLMLIRDQLTGLSKWTEYAVNLIDIDSGRPHTPAKGRQWQETVRSATKAIEEEVERSPVETDPSESEFGEMVAISRPGLSPLATSDSQDFSSQADSHSEISPSLMSKSGMVRTFGHGDRRTSSEF